MDCQDVTSATGWLNCGFKNTNASTLKINDTLKLSTAEQN